MPSEATAAARTALAALERATGLRLEIVGGLTGGEVGATRVRDQGGRRLVLKSWPGSREDGADLQARLALVARLRHGGYPAPAHIVAGWFDGHIVAVQRWVDGGRRDDLTVGMVEHLIALAERHAHVQVQASGAFQTWLVGSLLEGCAGYCVHAPLAAYSDETRGLLDRVRAIGADAAEVRLPATGLVHRDFHHRNVLWQSDDVAAVIDWEGAAAGDPGFDLVTLAFGLSVSTAPARARQLPWRSAERVCPADVLRAYAAHMALRQVDWAIRHHTDADVGHWLAVGRAALDRYAGEAPIRLRGRRGS